MSDYRSYEVYQRERVGDTTNLVNPRDFLSDEYLSDPFSGPAVLRENYPCYRDWVANRFWVTRYDDVTSIFADDANFETRPRRLAYGEAVSGHNLVAEPSIEQAVADCYEETIEALSGADARELLDDDLVTGFVEPLWHDMTALLLGAPIDVAETVDALVADVQQGTGWSEPARLRGVAAYRELVDLLGVVMQQGNGLRSLLTAATALDATPADVAATLVERDQSTLRASFTNLWLLLLSHPDQLAQVRNEPRLMSSAYLEAVRHSPAEPTINRFARHEVERFGRLLPQGALVHLSAAAANRDPRQFSEPDRFDLTRKDLCQREPRGQYRADGLPAAIMFGYGKPSQRPAVPKEAPRSLYAMSRDVVVAASRVLIERYPSLVLASEEPPAVACEQLGEPYRCSLLPINHG